MKTVLVLATLLLLSAYAQEKPRQTWDNDYEYQGYEWMEPISHSAHPVWDDPSLVDEVLVPKYLERRFGNVGIIEEYLEPELIEPRWVTQSTKLDFPSDPDVGKVPPKKPVSPLWTPSPAKVKQPLKPVPNTHRADSAGTQYIPTGTWSGGRF